MKISGLLIIKNGVKCGYTFMETLLTLDAICDEIVVCEGYSDDGTYELITGLNNPKIVLYRDPWERCVDGSEFARVTNVGLRRCTGDYILYLQADELLHERDFGPLRELIESDQYNSISLGFVHLRYDFHRKIADNAYNRAIRVVRNLPDITSVQDGYSFGGRIAPSIASPIIVYHAGYVFVENILRKMLNHYQEFYTTQESYRLRHDTATVLLERLTGGERLNADEIHQQLEPFYHLVPHGLALPYLVRPLIGKMCYDPMAVRSQPWPIPRDQVD